MVWHLFGDRHQNPGDVGSLYEKQYFMRSHCNLLHSPDFEVHERPLTAGQEGEDNCWLCSSTRNQLPKAKRRNLCADLQPDFAQQEWRKQWKRMAAHGPLPQLLPTKFYPCKILAQVCSPCQNLDKNTTSRSPVLLELCFTTDLCAALLIYFLEIWTVACKEIWIVACKEVWIVACKKTLEPLCIHISCCYLCHLIWLYIACGISFEKVCKLWRCWESIYIWSLFTHVTYDMVQLVINNKKIQKLYSNKKEKNSNVDKE